jgi:hypothetical protein
MNWLLHLDLIRFFEFHLAAVFIISVALRVRQYLAVVSLVRSAPQRWPRLLSKIKRNFGVFLTPNTLLSGLLAGGLLLGHTLACRLLWPQAELRIETLGTVWLVLPVVVVLGLAMTGFDVFTLTQVGTIDRKEIEGYLDQAEWWLRSWAAPLVSIATLGLVNPRKIVDDEVKKGLEALNQLLHSTLWWTSIQTGLRIAYGLSLWLTYAWLVDFSNG